MPDLDLGDAQQMRRALAHPFQIDVVDADHLAAVNVDDLAVDQVLLQIEVVALVFERSERSGGAQLERAGGRLHHLVGRHDAEAGAGFEHQAGHLAGIGAGGHGDVLEAAAQVALGVGHRGAEQRGETDTGCGARLHEVSVFPGRGGRMFRVPGPIPECRAGLVYGEPVAGRLGVLGGDDIASVMQLDSGMGMSSGTSPWLVRVARRTDGVPSVVDAATSTVSSMDELCDGVFPLCWPPSGAVQSAVAAAVTTIPITLRMKYSPGE